MGPSIVGVGEDCDCWAIDQCRTRHMDRQKTSTTLIDDLCSETVAKSQHKKADFLENVRICAWTTYEAVDAAVSRLGRPRERAWQMSDAIQFARACGGT